MNAPAEIFLPRSGITTVPDLSPETIAERIASDTPPPAPEGRKLPGRMWEDWMRCYPVLKNLRWWMLCNYLATRETFVSASHINSQPGLTYRHLKDAKDMFRILVDRGILIQRNSTEKGMTKIILYALSPATRRLLGLAPATFS